jgi:dTDP-4-amino-4,6-dideoxy-D-galactose acyltransferase
MTIEYLAWDSEFFEKKIGRITISESDSIDLSQLFLDAKVLGFDVLYLFSSSELSSDLIENTNVKLVDRKVVYQRKIDLVAKNAERLSEYPHSFCTSDLENLAYESGKFSRFRLDPFFSNDFKRLYKTWIEKSVTKEIADKIFVATAGEKIVGMITIKERDGVGHIGLIAVESEAKGRGYGRSLIEASLNFLFDKGVTMIEVPTQMDNVDACQFYEKCGFAVKSITYIYHFCP